MCNTSLEISTIRLLRDLSKRGVVSQKELPRPFKWNLSIFCLNYYFSLQNKVIFNFNASFNSHYLYLSNEVHNFILAQGAQQISAVKVWQHQKNSYLLHKTGLFLSPQTLTVGISGAPRARIKLYTSKESPLTHCLKKGLKLEELLPWEALDNL